MIWSAIVAYIAIGCAIFTIGPGARELAKLWADAREGLMSMAAEERSPLRVIRFVVTGLLLLIIFVASWPVLIASLLQEKLKAISRRRRWASSIEFFRMGGAGTVHCNACQYTEEVVSFVHGRMVDSEDCCTTGYQCLACGRFVSLDSEKAPLGDDTPCQCGGKLSREHILFCPMCRSKQLSYFMRYIT